MDWAAAGGDVERIGEAQIRERERADRVLQDRELWSGRQRDHRRVVDWGHVELDRVGTLVEIDTAILLAAVVLHLEREGGVIGAAGLSRRAELEVRVRDAGRWDNLALGDSDVRRAVEQRQRAGRRQGRDLDRQEAV